MPFFNKGIVVMPIVMIGRKAIGNFTYLSGKLGRKVYNCATLVPFFNEGIVVMPMVIHNSSFVAKTITVLASTCMTKTIFFNLN